jgi:hypothetical protein
METDIETSGEKKDLTLRMVIPVLNLSKLQTRAIFTGVLNKPQPDLDEPLQQRDIFSLLIGDMLERLAFLKAEQRMLILQELQSLFDNPEVCQECLKQLVFADGKHCTWTGQSGFTDLESGEQVTSLTHPPMETIAYNLDELYRRGVLLIEKRNGFHAKKSPAGSVDE